MKRAQLLGVAIAGVCGLGAFFGVMSLVNKPTKVVREEVTTNTTQVLVARNEIGLGQTMGPESFRWHGLAAERGEPELHSKKHAPERHQGAGRTRWRARRCWPGEPVTALKLVKRRRGRRAGRDPAGGHARHLHAHQGGDRRRPADPAQRPRRRHSHPHARAAEPAATSSPRRRSFTTCACSPSASSSRPRTARSSPRATPPRWSSPRRQAQRLAEANSGGEISLSLRSIADMETKDGPAAARRGDTIRIIRYGVKSGAYGVN